MIELAIAFMLLLLLVAGGVELGAAALHSQRLQAAAQAGVDQWSGVVGALGRVAVQASGASGPLNVAYGLAEKVADPASAASAGTYGLADHDPLVFDPPSCVLAELSPQGKLLCIQLDNGLPSLADDPDTPILEGHVHLFNPMPLDVTACVPSDAHLPVYEGCVDRLFDGCPAGDPACQGKRLPPLNRALYALYELHCLDDAATGPGPRQVACRNAQHVDLAQRGAARRYLLRLPGKYLRHADDAAGVAALADADPACVEGVVCLAVPDAEATPVNSLADVAPNPRALFGLRCAKADAANLGDCDSVDQPADVCWSQPAGAAQPIPLACKVEVTLRYRHVFNALLPSGFFAGANPDGQTLPLATAALMDLGQVEGCALVDPDDPLRCLRPRRILLSELDADQGGGGYGSEVTAQGGPAARSYFRIPARDFRACQTSQILPEAGLLRAPSLSCR